MRIRSNADPVLVVRRYLIVAAAIAIVVVWPSMGIALWPLLGMMLATGCCCSCPCDNCAGGLSAEEYQVEISGVVNDGSVAGCPGGCSPVNGTFVVTRTPEVSCCEYLSEPFTACGSSANQYGLRFYFVNPGPTYWAKVFWVGGALGSCVIPFVGTQIWSLLHRANWYASYSTTKPDCMELEAEVFDDFAYCTNACRNTTSTCLVTAL